MYTKVRKLLEPAFHASGSGFSKTCAYLVRTHTATHIVRKKEKEEVRHRVEGGDIKASFVGASRKPPPEIFLYIRAYILTTDPLTYLTVTEI